jgi:hypothetical protein
VSLLPLLLFCFFREWEASVLYWLQLWILMFACLCIALQPILQPCRWPEVIRLFALPVRI